MRFTLQCANMISTIFGGITSNEGEYLFLRGPLVNTEKMILFHPEEENQDNASREQVIFILGVRNTLTVELVHFT